MVHIVTNDDQHFFVERDVIERSLVVKHMLEDLGERDEAVPLFNVTGQVFQKVLEYCEHHRGEAVYFESDDLGSSRKRETRISPWDQRFLLSLDEELVFEVILAANYLDIQHLLDIGCRAVACSLKGKTSGEMREYFMLEKDFSCDEEIAIAMENAWAEDR